MAAQEVDAQPSDTLTTLKSESETLKTKLEEERAKLHDVERKNREPYVCLMKTYVRIIAVRLCAWRCAVNPPEEEIGAISHLDKVISVQRGDEEDNGGGGEGAFIFRSASHYDLLGNTTAVLTKNQCCFSTIYRLVLIF